jgi:T5SS/PEP-CTERM-associated repeat protein
MIRWTATVSAAVLGIIVPAGTGRARASLVTSRAALGAGGDIDRGALSLVSNSSLASEPFSLALAGLAAIAWVRYWRRRWRGGTDAINEGQAEAQTMRSTRNTARWADQGVLFGAVLTLALGAVGTVSAQYYHYQFFGSGSFQNAANWYNQDTSSYGTAVPGGTDTAILGGGARLLVTLDSDWAVNSLVLTADGGNVAMNGHTLTANNFSLHYDQFFAAVIPATMTLRDGTMRATGNVSLGGGGAVTGRDTTGTLTLDHAAFTAASFVNIGSDTSTAFNLNVINGGSFSAGGTAGSSVGVFSPAVVTVDGVGSSFSIGVNSAIGFSANATVNVQNGSTLATTGATSVAVQAAGTVNLSGRGSSWTHTDGYITAGFNGNTSAAAITVGAGSTMTLNGPTTPTGVLLGYSSTLTTAGVIAMNGVGATGILIGTNSTATVNALGSVAINSGAGGGIFIGTGGSLTVNTGGTVTVAGTGSSGINVVTSGTMTVNSGATVNTAGLTRGGTGVVSVNGGTLIVNGGAFANGSDGFNQLTGGTIQLQNAAAAANVLYLAVGSTDSTPATVNVLSGSTFPVTGTIAIGTSSGGTGTVLIDGPGSTMSTSVGGGNSSAIVGSVSGTGVGYLTVQNGGRFFNTDLNSSVLLAGGATAGGLVTVTGAGSRFDSGNLRIGGGGSGGFNVTAGAAATSGLVTIGEQNGSHSVASVSGAGSFWSTAGSFVVGVSGLGTLTISGGGTVIAPTVMIAQQLGGVGSATVSGVGSSLTSDGIYIGGSTVAAGGAGALTVTGGGGVSVSGTTQIWNTGSLTIDGGSLTTGSLMRSGGLTFPSGTLTINGGRFNNGASPTDLQIQGSATNTSATFQLVSGAMTSNIGALSVGDAAPGSLILGSAAQLTATSISTSTVPNGSSSITLTGAGSSLSTTGAISLGGSSAGPSTLSISAGSAVLAGTALNLNVSGTVNLNGGSLTMASLAANGGVFNWSSGTVLYSGNAPVDGPQIGALLGTAGALTAGRALGSTGGPLTLADNLTVAGGQLTGAINNLATLTVTSGTVRTSTLNNGGEIHLAAPGAAVGATASTLTNTGTISGTGRINSDFANATNGIVAVDAGQRIVFGGMNNNNSDGIISLTGGTIEFTYPLTNAASGFISGRGTFRANTSNYAVVTGDPADFGLKNTGVVALSGGFSDVYGKVNNLGGSYDVNHVFVPAGGQIINAGGGTLTFHDDVVNNGREIRTSAGARTVFLGGVSGAAPYTGTGTVEYQGDLRPGNSPDIVHYSGNLVFASSAQLMIEMEGYTPGANGYDQLVVDGSVDLGGAPLVLSFQNDFVPTVGSTFEIIDHTGSGPIMNTFAGLAEGATFTTGGVTFGVTYTGGNGNDVVLTTMSGVPEPSSLLLSATVAAVGLWYRSRGRRRVPRGRLGRGGIGGLTDSIIR